MCAGFCIIFACKHEPKRTQISHMFQRLFLVVVVTSAFEFQTSTSSYLSLSSSLQSSSTNTPSLSLYEKETRKSYDRNTAQFLLDLDTNKATFNFCGGMMFQLVLTEKLRARLERVSSNTENDALQPVVYDKTNARMFNIPEYEKSAAANNVNTFHGREIRTVKNAAGGMGFVLQVSDSESDPEGWSSEELATYDGWKHDTGREWRKLQQWEREGVQNFRKKFGPNCFGLSHKLYFHVDGMENFWMSAEDGCEGMLAEQQQEKKKFQFW